MDGWSKDKTLKLIDLLQMNASLWNPSLSDTRRDKQRQREELRSIAEILGASVPDVSRKLQHLRTQYNREWARERQAHIDDPNRYISNWYAFEYLHFLQSSKPFKVLQSMESPEMNLSSHSDSDIDECKPTSLSPLHKIVRMHPARTERKVSRSRDEFSVFGEYIANELRSLKGEKNPLVAKKKIQDVIFKVKMEIINELKDERHIFTSASYPHNTTESFSPVMSSSVHVESVSASPAQSTEMSKIVINGDYSNYKTDTQ